jgi:hypothetical protein
MTAYDAEQLVGDLEYYNVKLGARGLVSHGVSEFIEVTWPHQGIVYTVPTGDGAGIWFARAK